LEMSSPPVTELQREPPYIGLRKRSSRIIMAPSCYRRASSPGSYRTTSIRSDEGSYCIITWLEEPEEFRTPPF
jgi:hypothetical protein